MAWLVFIASDWMLAALNRLKAFVPEFNLALMTLPAVSRSRVVTGFLGSR